MAICAALVLLASGPGRSQIRLGADQEIWFTPNGDSPDMLNLFTQPDLWSAARARVAVFKFYQGNVRTVSPGGPNSYQALRSVGAFSKLARQWRKRIAIEAASVKPFFCTADASGMRAAILLTLESVGNVADAGGEVNGIAMDEPFLSGLGFPECGGPDPAPTIFRLRQYMRMVHAFEPRVDIGLIEPYPYFSAEQIVRFLALMRDSGIPAAFFQVDVDFHALSLRHYDFAGDMRRLKEACNLEGMPFGYIFSGENGDSDAVYVQQVMGKVDLIHGIFGSFDRLPDQLIFQSFAKSRSGSGVVPLNLPETNSDSHTGLIDRALPVLHGYRSTGGASPRRQP